jgi:MFS family permease
MSPVVAHAQASTRVVSANGAAGSVGRLHAVAAICGVAFGLTSPLTVVYATALGAGGLLAGVAVSSLSLVVLTIDFFGSRWTPRLEPRWALTVALVVFGIGSVISALAPDLAVMIGARCLQGVGAALFQGVGPQLAVRLRPAGQEGRALGQFQAAWFAGIAVGPLVGGAIVASVHGGQYLGLRWAFGTCALVSFVGALLVVALLPTMPTRLRPEIGLPRLRSMTAPRSVSALAVGGCGQAIRSGLALTLLPLAAARQYGLVGFGLGGALSILAVTDVTSMHYGGRLADRIGRLPVLLVALAIGTFAVLLTAMGHIPLQFCLLCLLLGVPIGVSWVVPSAMAVDLAPNTEGGLAAYRIAADIGLGCGGVMAGALLGALGTRSALTVAAVALLVPAGLALMVRETRSRSPGPVPRLLPRTG